MLVIKHKQYGLKEHRNGQYDLEKHLADGWVLASENEPETQEIEVKKRGRPRLNKDK